MVSKKKLSHYQEGNAQKKTPQKRVEFYGAKNYFSGENVAFVPFDTDMYYTHDRRKKTHFVGSYARVAYDMMIGWVNSRLHYENILNIDYSITGLAVGIDWTEKEAYCTQVFAEVQGNYEGKASPNLFPFESPAKKKGRTSDQPKRTKEDKKSDIVWQKIPWRLKVPTKDRHCKGDRSDFLKGEQVKPQRSGKNMSLCVYDLNRFKRTFQRRKDGLAFEFISFAEAFSCEEGNMGLKRNLNNVDGPIEGYLQKPVYKKDILRQVETHLAQQRGKRKQRNQCFTIDLGEIPPQYLTRKTDVRLVWIQKKRICEVIQFQPICGNLLDHDPPQIPLPINVEPDSNFRPSQAPEVFEFLVPFDKNSTQFDRALLKPLFELLAAEDVIVRKARIEAFASLEGSLAQNTKLFRKRADQIMSAIGKVQEDSIPTEVIAKENWKDFMKDVKDSDYKFLLKLDSTEIKAYLNKNSHKLEHILKDHRYTAAKFYVYQKLNPQNTLEFAVDEFNARALELVKRKKLPRMSAERLMKIQNYVHWKGPRGDTSWQNLYIPNTQAFSRFALNQWLFVKANTDIEARQFYQALKGLSKFLGDDDDYLFAVYTHILNNKNDDYLGELLSKAKLQFLLESENIEENVKEEVRLLYHLLNANSIFLKYGGRNLKRAKSSLKFVKSYYDEKELSDDKLFQLASFYVLFHQYTWAEEALAAAAKREEPNGELLSFFLKISAFQDLEEGTTSHSQLLLDAQESLGEKAWCNLFLGPCNINFHIFDDVNVLREYCESCR